MKVILTISPRELYQLLSEAMAAKGIKLDSVNVVANTTTGPSYMLSIVRHQPMPTSGMRGTLSAGGATATWDEE